MLSGNVASWFGLGDHLDLTVGIFRILGEITAVVIVGYLLFKPQGRTPVQAMAWAFLAVVALGPVVQPWYLLWVLPLVAASGLTPRQLQVVLLFTAAFTLYGLWETSATSDSILEPPTAWPCSPPRPPSGSRSRCRRGSGRSCSARRPTTGSCPTTPPRSPAGRCSSSADPSPSDPGALWRG